MVEFTADSRHAKAESDDYITTGSVGIPVTINLSDDFDNLDVTICFRSGNSYADVMYKSGDDVCIPSEVLVFPGENLQMGVFATSADGLVAIPTIWASCGVVRLGTLPSGVGVISPQPSWASEIYRIAANAQEIAQSVRDDADNGEFDGEQGIQGVPGPQGPKGDTGERGLIGPQGPKGDAGDQGPRGEQGLQGIPGEKGSKGDTGERGPQGEVGPRGATGPQGPQGEQGPKGDTGATGPQGEKGDTGATGPQGEKGDTGATGPQGEIGPTGPQGPQGLQGETGATGPQGEAGADGFSPTVSVLPITGGHEVTITDAQGPHTFDVMDGEGGTDFTTQAHVAQLWGNQLTKELSGEILTAADAYAAPPVALIVDGKSTQFTTTGKNLFDPDKTPYGYYDGSTGAFVANNNYRWWSVSVVEGDVIRYANSVDCRMTYWNGGAFVSSHSQTASATYTVEAGIEEIRGYTHKNYANQCIVTKNNADLTYEPYTGGKPSPSPDYPQEIESIEDIDLVLTERNIFDTNFTQTYTVYGLTVENDGTGIFKITTTITSGGLRARAFGKNKEIFGSGAYPTDFTIDPNTAVHLPKGTYRVVASPTVNNTHICIRYGKAGATGGNARNVENGGTITSDGSLYYYGCIYTTNAGTIPASGLNMFVMLMRSEVSTPTSYEPYQATTTPLYDGTLRSLPNGTKDTLALSYLRPSTREGWAWYSRELTTAVGYVVLNGTETWAKGSGLSYRMYTARNDIRHATNYQQRMLCSSLKVYPHYDDVGNGVTGISSWHRTADYPGQNWFYVAIDGITTAAAMKQWFTDNPAKVLYELVTPTVTTLDPIELPVLPAPNCTVWADSATGLRMEYMRDTNIAYAQLEAALADLATS